MGVTFPLVVIAYDLYSGKKVTFRSIVEKAPFFLLSALSVAIALGYLFPFSVTPAPLPLWDRFDNVIQSFFFYLSHFLLPINLIPFYEGTWSRASTLDFALGIALIALMTVGCFLSPRIRKDLYFGLGFFLITVSIVLQFFLLDPGPFRLITSIFPAWV